MPYTTTNRSFGSAQNAEILWVSVNFFAKQFTLTTWNYVVLCREFLCSWLIVDCPALCFNKIADPNGNQNSVTDDARGRKTPLIKPQVVCLL